MSPGTAFDAAWLRGRFADRAEYTPLTSGDGHLWCREDEIRPAAVLVPVVERAGRLSLLLTKRTAHLQDHGGQISFPGGRTEDLDRDLHHTALRETEEEIGLRAEHVEVLGELNAYVTVTGYRVAPVVGLVPTPFDLRLDAREVASVFEMPLENLLDPVNHVRHTVVYADIQRYYYALPYQDHYIWGATAGMLLNFYKFLIR
jgi:8-oxo-dGTP pyrophosphatase MutT (NUDIX family)